MPEPEESSHGALSRFDKRLDAFEANRAGKPRAGFGIGESASDGYRMLGEMLGGVLGGVGLGWLVDHFAHTSPWGVVGGLLIGAGLSIYATVLTASRISARASKLNPVASAPAKVDDDDDD
jgi:ATP synthase protein I